MTVMLLPGFLIHPLGANYMDGIIVFTKAGLDLRLIQIGLLIPMIRSSLDDGYAFNLKQVSV